MLISLRHARYCVALLLAACFVAVPVTSSAEIVSNGSSDGADTSASASGATANLGARSADGPDEGPENSGTGSSGGADPCTYQVIDDPSGGRAAGMNFLEHVKQAIADAQAKQGQPNWEQGTYLMVSCPGQTPYGIYSIPGQQDQRPPSAYDLATQATQSVTVTTPPVNFNPYWLLEDGRNATIKNAETWVWIDPANWTGYQPRVESGAVWVEATITPIQIVITPNDGSTEPKTCNGPGTPISKGIPLSEPSPTCSLKFTAQTDGNTWPVTVQVVYSVTWSGFTGTSTVSGTLQNLISAPAPYPLAVLTTKARLVDPKATD